MYYIVKFVKYNCGDGANKKNIKIIIYVAIFDKVRWMCIICTLFELFAPYFKKVKIYNQSYDNYRTCRNYDVLLCKRK